MFNISILKVKKERSQINKGHKLLMKVVRDKMKKRSMKNCIEVLRKKRKKTLMLLFLSILEFQPAHLWEVSLDTV